MSSRPRRLAVLAVATTLAASTSTALAAPAPSSSVPKPLTHWVVTESATPKPPASVTGLAGDLGVDTDLAWRLLDELSVRR